MSKQEYTDETLMPWGKYKGEKLANIPAWYLLGIKERGTGSKELEDNLEILKLERDKGSKVVN